MSSSLPGGTAREHLRAHLALLYFQSIISSKPTDQIYAAYCRINKKVVGGGRRFLGAALYGMLRMRVRTIASYTLANDPKATGISVQEMQKKILPSIEAAAAMIRWLTEDLEVTQKEAKLECERMISHLQQWKNEKFFPNTLDLNLFADTLRNGLSDYALWLQNNRDSSSDHSMLNRVMRFSLPDFLLERWDEKFGSEIVDELALSLHRPAPLDIRVNTPHFSTVSVSEVLREHEIEVEPLKSVRLGFRLNRKYNLKSFNDLPKGSYEVQDFGSQLICEALEPKPDSTILDACAGAGGKTLNIAALTGDQAKVYAHDIDRERLEKLTERVKESGYRSIRTMTTAELSEKVEFFDQILIDAPCLGLGRLRRDPSLSCKPDLRERLSEFALIQKQCLHDYARLLKPGGTLVYATCSFEKEETDEQIQAFLSSHHNFRPEVLPAVFQTDAFVKTRSRDGSSVVLLPSLHNTDGFFIARLQRTAL